MSSSSAAAGLGGCRLHIGHAPYEATERDYARFFKGYGRIQQIVLKNGFAFVELDEPRAAEAAIRDLNGARLMGMEVTVEYAKTPSYSGDPGVWRYNVRDQPRPSNSLSLSPLRRSPTPREALVSCRARSPRAAEWYGGIGKRRRSRESSPKHSTRSSPISHRRRHHRRSRSRSPLRSARHSPTPGSGIAKREPLPNLDEYLEEYDCEEDEAISASDFFFKLLEHQPELELIAKELRLDINIRPFDASIAFGGLICSTSGGCVKKEPQADSAGREAADSASAEKWLVFADKGPHVRMTSYEQNTLMKEYDIPKFEWEPFSGAIRGMCEKFLLAK